MDHLRQRRRHLVPAGSWLVAVALATGCGTRPPDLPRPGAPSIDAFAVDADTVITGGPARLTWTATGATALRIEPAPGDVTTLTEVTVRPTATTTYTLVASNGHGAVSASVTVRTASFVPLAAMQTPRAGATATLLFDGKILVAGGETGSGPTDTAEVFDPATNTFTATAGKMATARHDHLAVLTRTGQVIIAGGRGSSGPLSSIEVWDPVTQTFSSGGDLIAAREGLRSMLVDSGLHLLTGGASTASSELLAVQPLGALPGPAPGRARAFHGMTGAARTSQSPARVFLTGGVDPDGAPVATTESYQGDAGSGAFASGPDLLTPRSHHGAVQVGLDVVLVIGGRDGAGPLRSMEQVDFAAGTAAAAGELSAPRADFVAHALFDGRTLLIGGTSSGGTPLASTEVLDPASGALLPGPALGVARARACAAGTFDDRLLVAGGTTASGPTASAEVLERN